MDVLTGAGGQLRAGLLSGLLTVLAASHPTALVAQTPAPPPAPPAAGPQPPATTSPVPQKGLEGLALQVALDRAGFSPGIVDGQAGNRTKQALQRFQEARGLAAS
ncbi:MAG TPA: peptidoglycan-binding domain-containing protein, partial [Luteitalea sp.]|nr:peptidoglycan-binding domain-containing protein [Luteitalea sp.]